MEQYRDAIMIAGWLRSSTLLYFFKFILHHFRLRFTDYYRGMSRTFLFVLVVVTCIQVNHFLKTWSEPINLFSHFLVLFMGRNYAIYSLMYPEVHRNVPQRQSKINLNLSTFATVLSAKLPYILAFVDLQLRPSLFNLWGLVSFIICFLTEVDIYLFHWRPALAGQPRQQLDLNLQLYFQSFLRFLVLVGLIVFGGAFMIDKAWNGVLLFDKHVLVILSIWVFAYIHFREKYQKLKRAIKKAMRVVPPANR